MVELFGSEKERRNLERDAGDRPPAPQTGAVVPTTVYWYTLLWRC
jgi:hypothetical protein